MASAFPWVAFESDMAIRRETCAQALGCLLVRASKTGVPLIANRCGVRAEYVHERVGNGGGVGGNGAVRIRALRSEPERGRRGPSTLKICICDANIEKCFIVRAETTTFDRQDCDGACLSGTPRRGLCDGTLSRRGTDATGREASLVWGQVSARANLDPPYGAGGGRAGTSGARYLSPALGPRLPLRYSRNAESPTSPLWREWFSSHLLPSGSRFGKGFANSLHPPPDMGRPGREGSERPR